MHYLHLREIAELAKKYRLPAVSDFSEFAEAGGLIAYGPSFPAIYRRAAWYVDRILNGSKAADLPIEYPTRLQLIFNLKMARAIGVIIPRPLVQRADRVIE